MTKKFVLVPFAGLAFAFPADGVRGFAMKRAA
jgi:hypothetical protein